MTANATEPTFLQSALPWIGGGLGMLGVKHAYDSLGKLGEEARSGARGIADEGRAQSQFKPYTVTSGLGTTSAHESGTDLNLAPQQQAMQNQLGQGAQGFFNQAMQGTTGREQDVFNRIRAMQSPEEQRQRLQLETRMNNQGRMGVRTSMFGGTPEQFSMDQAQAEARNQAALMAMQQGQSEQAQQGQLGSQFLQNQYMPQAALMQQGQLGLQNANLQQAAQLYGAGLYGEANMGGLEAYLGSGLGQANLMGNVGSGLLAGLFGGSGNYAGGLFDFLRPSTTP